MLPISIQLLNKPVVVIGGGVVAFRRIKTVLAEGAQVIVVSPDLHPSLQELFGNDVFVWKARPFQETDVVGAFVVIAATNNHEINAQVLACCPENQLINIVNDAQSSTFHFPAVAKRGLLGIAVSTDGANPALAKKISEDIASQFDDVFIDYLAFVKEARTKILHATTEPMQKKILLKALMEEALDTPEQQKQFLLKI